MNIALVKLSSLGDVVHALPVAATLRARLPGVRLSWIVERREATLLVGHPGLDEVLTVDTRLWRRARSARGIAGAAGAVGRLRRRLEAGRFDVALDLQGLLKSGLLVRLTRAPIRIGFNAGFCREPLSALFTNRRVTPPPEAAHVVDQYLALLEPLGVRERVVEFNLPSDPGAETRIDDFFAAAGLKPRNRVVVLNPGAGRRNKRWPTERFRALAMWLADEAAAHVLVVWGPGEEAAARAIVAEPATGRRVLAPDTTLYDLMAVLRRASLLVAGDTGPLHLAAALGTPCVGIYGPTRAERNGPYGAGHRVLQGPGGRVDAVGIEAVFAAATELLG
ncbi:MAG: lipopolysaccharide heptosyltransferase I [Candidatus Rokubacteria bacterium 13_1_40CM_69_27]|nr:MAG: lipopolysaccharide heptosyltransferase I [Candidatus Rokubacteria bacterium 13_1_40CM_69_27]OLC33543.1 MAG: lipopolysaccharide heptosyltransferase I [Candidatus Rokubacteria bacterium 13_1_40CM_4_69_5]OLE38619.1 MAG: lipopolysaccharide heptosyltransferase I [Candidatus Rokubacteria bacterium 13_1_20CM_2_70_7]